MGFLNNGLIKWATQHSTGQTAAMRNRPTPTPPGANPQVISTRDGWNDYKAKAMNEYRASLAEKERELAELAAQGGISTQDAAAQLRAFKKTQAATVKQQLGQYAMQMDPNALYESMRGSAYVDPSARGTYDGRREGQKVQDLYRNLAAKGIISNAQYNQVMSKFRQGQTNFKTSDGTYRPRTGPERSSWSRNIQTNLPKPQAATGTQSPRYGRTATGAQSTRYRQAAADPALRRGAYARPTRTLYGR